MQPSKKSDKFRAHESSTSKNVQVNLEFSFNDNTKNELNCYKNHETNT